jgi:hypothetical protein
MTDEQDLRECLEYLELDGNQIANVLAIFEVATAELRADRLR